MAAIFFTYAHATRDRASAHTHAYIHTQLAHTHIPHGCAATVKTALHKFLDKEGCSWVVEGGNAFCVMLQAAAAKAAKSKMASEKGTNSTNVEDYAKKDLQEAFASATVTTSVLLELFVILER